MPDLWQKMLLEVKKMDEGMDKWMAEAFKRAWLNFANKKLLEVGMITEQEYRKMEVIIANMRT